MFRKISRNASIEFGNMCSFKVKNFLDMNFSDNCFRFTLISDSENHKSHDIFLSFFLDFHPAFFMAFSISTINIFGKLKERNSVIGPVFCYAAGLRVNTFLTKFSGIFKPTNF